MAAPDQLISSSLLGALCAVLLLSQSAQSSAQPTNAPPDASYLQRVVGTWEDDYEGHRTMTVRPDGTATMIVQLHGWKARLYASSLRFEMTWTIRDGRMQKRTTGGDPPGKVKTILKLMGDHVDERILELTPERLLLLDQYGKRQYDWRRVKTKDLP